MPKTVKRIRTYTFRVVCPLPRSRDGEPKTMVSYIYGQKDQESARKVWFQNHLVTAKKNGLRGKDEQLQQTLKLEIERVTITGDPRLAEAFAK